MMNSTGCLDFVSLALATELLFVAFSLKCDDEGFPVDWLSSKSNRNRFIHSLSGKRSRHKFFLFRVILSLLVHSTAHNGDSNIYLNDIPHSNFKLKSTFNAISVRS